MFTDLLIVKPTGYKFPEGVKDGFVLMQRKIFGDKYFVFLPVNNVGK